MKPEKIQTQQKKKKKKKENSVIIIDRIDPRKHPDLDDTFKSQQRCKIISSCDKFLNK